MNTAIKTMQMFAEKSERKEGFSDDDIVPLVILLLFVMWVVLVLFLGKTLWNKTLVPATGLKQVDYMQFLGIFVLVRIFLMFMN